MSKLHHLFTVLPAVLVILQAVRPGAGQVLFGSIVGSVTDASGAAVRGATVTVTQIETNESRETVTDAPSVLLTFTYAFFGSPLRTSIRFQTQIT